MTKLWRDHMLGRPWTDFRPVCLRGKLIVTSRLVTFTKLKLVMHVCRFPACLGLYGIVLYSFSKTNLCTCTRIVCPSGTEPPSER
eukprot:3514142-Pleurochrysis_carterae.AAC.1